MLCYVLEEKFINESTESDDEYTLFQFARKVDRLWRILQPLVEEEVRHEIRANKRLSPIGEILLLMNIDVLSRPEDSDDSYSDGDESLYKVRPLASLLLSVMNQ